MMSGNLSCEEPVSFFMNRGTTIALLLCLAAVDPAFSCSTVVGIEPFEDRVADAFAQATFVFLGEVESVETVMKRHTLATGRIVSDKVQIARLKVLKSWKGDEKAADLVVSHAEQWDSGCTWTVRPGEQWLVYASSVDPVLTISARNAQPALDSADIPVIERILRGEPAREVPEPSIEVPEPNIAFEADALERAQP